MEINIPLNEKKIVLVCDDSKSCLQAMKRALIDNYHVITASSGYEALSFAILYSPDIIIMDVMMYGLTGFETLVKLRQNKITKDIPVVFISAMAGKDAKEYGLKLGAVDWIEKPADLQRIFDVIEKYSLNYAKCA